MMNEDHLVIVFVSDLYFSPRIESAAEGVGFRVQLIETASQIAPGDLTVSDEPLGEHLEGQAGRLIEQVTAWQPALMIFDLNNGEVPWERWIPVLKTSAATRRIPILAFGSHMDVGTMGRAKAVGAEGLIAGRTPVGRGPGGGTPRRGRFGPGRGRWIRDRSR
ncbi:MAG: hypothetical protein HUU38_13435 [Anaerolineales bacterium]|nr:hypothetical protein [Anaerolineales bacterium]